MVITFTFTRFGGAVTRFFVTCVKWWGHHVMNSSHGFRSFLTEREWPLYSVNKIYNIFLGFLTDEMTRHELRNPRTQNCMGRKRRAKKCFGLVRLRLRPFGGDCDIFIDYPVEHQLELFELFSMTPIFLISDSLTPCDFEHSIHSVVHLLPNISIGQQAQPPLTFSAWNAPPPPPPLFPTPHILKPET